MNHIWYWSLPVFYTNVLPESIKRFIEDQAFSLSCYLAPPQLSPCAVSKLSLLVFRCVAGRAYLRGGGGGLGRTQIIKRRESLVFHKSLNTRSVVLSSDTIILKWYVLSKKGWKTSLSIILWTIELFYGNFFKSLIHKAGSLKRNTALEYSTRVVQEGGRRCKKSTYS